MRVSLAAALAATTFATAAFAGHGSGHLVTETRPLRGFTGVELAVPFDIVVREGQDFQVKVRVDQDLLQQVKTEVKENTLHVRFEGHGADGDSRIEIVLPDLRAVASASSGDVRVTASRRKDMSIASAGSGDLSYTGPAAHLRIGTSGTGDVAVHLDGDADDVEIGTKGSGDIRVEGGHARELIAAVAGSGSVNAQDLPARDGKLATSGSGDIEVTLEGGHASFAVAGSGGITWHGSASVDQQARAGSGEIHHEN
jgi:putative autotransporter adhesin-like protein